MKKWLSLLLCIMLIIPMLYWGSDKVLASESGVVVEDSKTTFSDAGSEMYDEIRDKTSDEFYGAVDRLVTGERIDIIGGVMENDYGKQFWVFILYIWDMWNQVWLFFIFFSLAIGALVYRLSVSNKRRRRIAVRVFMVLLPWLSVGIKCLPILYDKYVLGH